MKIARYFLWAPAVLGLLLGDHAFAQNSGDYRSAAVGNWSDAATWEMFDGANWVAAVSAPTGAENITVDGNDTVQVDIAVEVTGVLKVTENAEVEAASDSLAFGDGGIYEHARDEGSIPTATWNQGSTLLLTGIIGTSPSNRNQNYFNITLNTPDMSSNQDLGLNDVTIGGDIHVLSSGSARWRLTSASSGDTSIVTIMGDVVIEDGRFETQGTGNALTTFIVHHYGNINVTGGIFAVSRGSQGSGSGTTTWYLYSGDFSMSNAETRNSNPTAGNARFVFAKKDSQKLAFDNVEYGGGQIHFEVSDSTILQITNDFAANGLLINKGEVVPEGTLTFMDGSVYEHARDGGSVPTATWEVGSTALFTGITGSAPDNRGQDYHHLILNTAELSSNRDLGLQDHTIGGNITVLNSGSARWRLVGGSSGVVTIMGDVIVEDGSLETQGTSSETEVEVRHHGNVLVTGGTFAVSRGSQGGENGTGSTRWYLLEGDFSLSNATARNSNPWRATFVFAKDNGTQNLWLTNVDYGSGGLPIEVDSTTTLNMDTTSVGGSGNFVLSAGATLATAHPGGFNGSVQTTGDIIINEMANLTFNGMMAQTAGISGVDTLGTLTIESSANVSFNDTLFCQELVVAGEGGQMNIDSLGNVTATSGSVAGSVVNRGVLEAIETLTFLDASVYNHASNEGSIPNGQWNFGSNLWITGTIDTAPGNRNQNYSNITFNTPNLASNRDMSLDDVTISGNIRVIDTGSSRWRLTSASAGDTAIVTIMGDVMVEGGSFETQGTGNALTVFEVHHYGDVIVTGGTFAVSRGSQGSGSGSTRWFMHEGDFSITGGTTRNSNPTNAWFVFDKDSTQNIELNDVSYSGGGLPIEVVSGTTLDFGTSELGGNGLFVLNAGATLATAHEGGVDSTIQSTGDITLNEGASFSFNGTTAQITGIGMPTTVNGLTIDNDGGVTLSQETTISGVLRLIAGVFDNTIPFTLGENGSISFEGGSLLVPTSVGEAPTIPTEFALLQNYPNPFNPSTTLRFDVAERTHVTLKIYDVRGREVAELINEEQDPGAYELVWNASRHASGVYYYRFSAGDFHQVRKLTLLK